MSIGWLQSHKLFIFIITILAILNFFEVLVWAGANKTNLHKEPVMDKVSLGDMGLTLTANMMKSR